MISLCQGAVVLDTLFLTTHCMRLDLRGTVPKRTPLGFHLTLLKLEITQLSSAKYRYRRSMHLRPGKTRETFRHFASTSACNMPADQIHMSFTADTLVELFPAT